MAFTLPTDFYSRYWQREPLLIRNAVPGFRSPITPDELAGLACMEDVEARIVLPTGTTPWEVRYGPFAETVFADLPEREWTLLVQAVDHWDAEVAGLRRLFPAIPNWRLDDVMVSYAADGGSVGPHVDQYDVFLLQGLGSRRWCLGGPVDDRVPLVPGTDLQILASFKPREEIVLAPGDALYIPPGESHWGIAEGECMTYSIGFRAPSEGGIVDAYAASVAERLADNIRYRDPPINDARRTHPGEITEAAIEQAKSIIFKHLDGGGLARWFGSFVTEPRDSIEPLELATEVILTELEAGALCRPYGASRFAYRLCPDTIELFADAQQFDCPTSALPCIERLCDGLEVDAADIARHRDLVVKLIQQGSLELIDPSPIS